MKMLILCELNPKELKISGSQVTLSMCLCASVAGTWS